LTDPDYEILVLSNNFRFAITEVIIIKLFDQGAYFTLPNIGQHLPILRPFDEGVDDINTLIK